MKLARSSSLADVAAAVAGALAGSGIRAVLTGGACATDSCRDRLAAFYHWRDRQSLVTAVQIARRRKVNITAIRDWSSREGSSAGFDEFLALLGRGRRRGRRG